MYRLTPSRRGSPGGISIIADTSYSIGGDHPPRPYVSNKSGLGARPANVRAGARAVIQRRLNFQALKLWR